MKRYKLLKDLPTFKAGQLAYISERGNLIAGTPDNPETTDARIQLMMYHKQTIDKFPEILTEWFEEVKEPTDSIHWNPSIGEKCFILENTNIRSTFYTGMLRDYNAWRTGKIFRTKEECEKARDRELAEIRLRRTSTFKPDFKNDRGGYVVFYNPEEDKLETHNVYCYDYGEIVRYETVEEAEKSIKENREDWLIYFGIKEER
jgi:hypothetical protein